MNTFIFTKFAAKKFLRLPKSIQFRIREKLVELKTHQDLFSILKKLHHFEPASHRLRIGDYRLILEMKSATSKGIILQVLDVGARKDIYS